MFAETLNESPVTLAKAVPVSVKLLVRYAVVTPRGTAAHVPSPRQKVDDDAPLPPFICEVEIFPERLEKEGCIHVPSPRQKVDELAPVPLFI